MSDQNADPGALTAWQRWELASLDAPAVVNLPTAQDVDRMVAAAHQEGFQAGYQDGLRAAQAEAANIAQLGRALHDAGVQLAARVETDLVRLAVAMARQIVRNALDIKPELVVPLVQEAVASLPMFKGQVVIHLHPADVTLVRQHLAADIDQQGWVLQNAPDLQRGGCRIETGVNQIDASLEERWKTLLASFAAADGWER